MVKFYDGCSMYSGYWLCLAWENDLLLHDLQYRTVIILKTLLIGTVATIINEKIHSLASIISYVLIYTQLASYVNLPHSHFGAMGKSSRHITLSSTTTNTHSISLHGSTKRLSLKHNKLLEKGVPLKIR
jgi:hypothetical protein